MIYCRPLCNADWKINTIRSSCSAVRFTRNSPWLQHTQQNISESQQYWRILKKHSQDRFLAASSLRLNNVRHDKISFIMKINQKSTNWAEDHWKHQIIIKHVTDKSMSSLSEGSQAQQANLAARRHIHHTNLWDIWSTSEWKYFFLFLISYHLGDFRLTLSSLTTCRRKFATNAVMRWNERPRFASFV